MKVAVRFLVSMACLIYTTYAQTPFNYGTCAAPNTTVNGAGAGTAMPAMPQFPSQFQTRVEGNIIDKGYTMVIEEYYDFLNNRAAIRVIQNDTLNYMIFDYANDQVLNVVNGVCTADILVLDPNNDLFGMKISIGKLHVFSSTGALHFAQSNGLTYKGQAKVREIPVDHWQSCMYWDNLFSNFTLDYYFTRDGWTTPDNSSQVPVMAEVNGVQNMPGKPTVTFHHQYDYFDFRKGIWGDDSLFETPPGTTCTGRIQTRTVPQLSGRYSYREEIVDTQNSDSTQADVWYDYGYKLIRMDYRNPYPKYPYYNTNPVMEIHDYSTGIAYGIDKITNNCTIFPITNVTIDARVNLTINANNSQEFYLKMSSPSQMFYLDNSSYTYEGKRTIRNMLCDIFIGQRTDFKVSDTTVINATFEFAFLDTNWAIYNNVGAVSSATSVPIQLTINAPAAGYYAIYNIYNFDAEDPNRNTFDVSACFQESAKKHFIIEFPGVYDPTQLVTAPFQQAVVDQIVRIGHVSYIRVQNGQFSINPTNAFFVGTLLDLPPPLAYFRLDAGKRAQFSNDATVVGSGPDDCARSCNDAGTLDNCNSFDWCPGSNLCSLSRTQTQDGSKIVSSQGACDHYSRTLAGQNFELSTDKAWVQLKNMVLTGDFTLNVNGNKYTAATIDENVLRNSGRQSTMQSLMSRYNVQINKNIHGYDDLILTGIAIDDCAYQCLNQQSWVCNSFSFCFSTGYCVLRKVHPDERPGIVINEDLCDLYSLKYTSAYHKTRGTTILSNSDTIYQNIYTADECGKLCSNYNGFNCLSFDYCDDISTCYLGKTHFYDTPASDKVDSPMCDHYSRDYLADFLQQPRTALKNVDDRIVSAVDIHQCARLCVQMEASACATFGYCGNTSECRLSTQAMRNIGQTSSEVNLWCDVYTRQTFPDGTPYTPNAQKYYSNLNQSTGYTGGAMAGLAFAMIIVGVILALGVYFGVNKFRGKQPDNMAVSFVKEEDA